MWIDLPAGLISVEEGPRMAASSQITINVKGKQGHGAQPHQAIDAIVVASAIVMNLQTVVSRNVSALDSLVLTIGNIHSGSEWNVILVKLKWEGPFDSLTQTKKSTMLNLYDA